MKNMSNNIPWNKGGVSFFIQDISNNTSIITLGNYIDNKKQINKSKLNIINNDIHNIIDFLIRDDDFEIDKFNMAYNLLTSFQKIWDNEKWYIDKYNKLIELYNNKNLNEETYKLNRNELNCYIAERLKDIINETYSFVDDIIKNND